MKIKFYILIFFILFSGTVFSQDTLVGIKGLTFEEINKQVDTIFIKENKYVLSKADKDSIFNSVYLQEKTQQLLESYKIGNNQDIFLAENHLNFLSILNSNLVQYDIKRDFLINRIRHDEKTIKTKGRNIITYSDRISPPQSNTTNNKQPVRIKQPYYSKDEAIAQFLNKQNLKEHVDFSYAYYLFIEIDHSKEQPIQNIEFRSNKKSGSQTKLPSLKKTTRKINKTHIVAIDYFPNYVSFPLGHAITESVSQIIIYYEN